MGETAWGNDPGKGWARRVAKEESEGQVRVGQGMYG